LGWCATLMRRATQRQILICLIKFVNDML